MTTSKFVASALSYALGCGVLSKKRKGTTWLSIRRPESQTQYLRSQLETLLKNCPTQPKFSLELRGSDSFYAYLELRFQAEALSRAYRLLYPRDRRQISSAVLDIAGLEGMAALWSDCGYRSGRRYSLIHRGWSPSDWEALCAWLAKKGYPAQLRTSRSQGELANGVLLGRSSRDQVLPDLVQDISPLLHPECCGMLPGFTTLKTAP